MVDEDVSDLLELLDELDWNSVQYVEDVGCFANSPDEDKVIWTPDVLEVQPALMAAASGEFAPLALSKIYGWIDPHYRTMRRSGIVGNAAHLAGYHRSRQRLLNVGKTGDYSIQAPADKRGEKWACCGIDISFGSSEMKIATARLMRACRPKADGSYDPRIEPIREFFGTLDGRRVTGWNRYASSNRRVGFTTSDSSHLWHVHISAFRDYADDLDKMKGIADVLNGVPLDNQPTPGDDDVVTAADRTAIAKEVVKLLNTDGLFAAPTQSPSIKENPNWAASSIWRRGVDLGYVADKKLNLVVKMLTDDAADTDAIRKQLAEIDKEIEELTPDVPPTPDPVA